MEGTGGFIDLTDKTDWYFIAIGKERAQRGEEGPEGDYSPQRHRGHGVWGSN
jgi:hypothetical protein